ncbi:MAG: ATP synthase F1 subunit epsilon [Candidatus Omnitrophica bacterium]|nr:ATP synthase F1 subunit epsilon [Candidatus Omnitrophota bacterium]
MSFQLSIVSPDGRVFDDTVDSVSIPGIEGGFEVYSQHTPLISVLKSGHARIRRGEQVTAYVISSGILEVTPQHDVVLLADEVTPVS